MEKINKHKEATEIIEALETEEAFLLLHEIARKNPDIVIDSEEDVFDEMWGIQEAIEADRAFI